jgi:uncharacterized membrane protein
VVIIVAMTKTRIEAFSDGVFAIAITLLVLNLHPDKSVTHQWPSYAAFAFGFLTIGVMWVNHHHLLHQFGHVDRVLLFLNMLLLLGIVFIPFPTALIAEHIRDGDARTATLAYGCTGIVLAMFFNALWHYGAHGRRLLRADTRMREVSGITRSYLPGIPLYLTGTLVSFASPVASAAVYAGIAVFYAISNTFFGKEPVG